jgi:pentatricopeptide repeat protein
VPVWLRLKRAGVFISRSCKSGLESHVFVGSSLVDMYAKCGSIDDAGNVFKKMSSRDVVSCTVMILAHMQCREWQEAFELFEQMQ